MNKLFLLPVIALVAVLNLSLISATYCGQDNDCATPSCSSNFRSSSWVDCVSSVCNTMVSVRQCDWNHESCGSSGLCVYCTSNDICVSDADCPADTCKDALTKRDWRCNSNHCCEYSDVICSGEWCDGGQCVPEFTTIGAGIALIGAGAGYALIRKKRK